MAEKTIKSFEEFWPYYVGEHSKPITRNLHFFGTHLGLLNLVVAIAFLQPLYILSGLVCGYGFAWIGHFFLEKNRPATFTYPAWSFRGDFKMLGLMWRGKMTDEVSRCARRNEDRTIADRPAVSSP